MSALGPYYEITNDRERRSLRLKSHTVFCIRADATGCWIWRRFNVVEDWNLTFEAAGFGPAVPTRLPSLPGGFGNSLTSHGSSTSGVAYPGLNQVPQAVEDCSFAVRRVNSGC